ncbi:unnamed protein product [Clonostachys rhizophaga]|uniref:Uncharacterized protein n=1 Tax=Clonostachys rhizophaga TaxID=160324 RepID=A0A9N9VM25_9HYPO|nr:unnamed protein product [Clonostachys rhizophaga]
MATPTMTSPQVILNANQKHQPESTPNTAHETKKIISKIQSVLTQAPSTTFKLATNPASIFRSSSRATTWPDPLASIGAAIDTGTKKMDGLKAWFTKGPARETFESKILPELEHLLENCGLPEGAPLFLRDYMIGPSEIRAAPTVMICCIDKNILAKAKRCVSENGVVKSHGFKLGCSALYLEARTMPIKCMEELPLDEENDDISRDSRLGSTLLGRRVFFRSDDNGNLRAATGGPVVMLGGDLYQLTVAHVLEREDQDSIHRQELDLDSFELESDNEERGFEYEGATTSLGSISSDESLDETDPDEDGERSGSSGDKLHRDAVCKPEFHQDQRLENQALDSSPGKLQLPAKQVWPGRHVEDNAICSSPKPSRTLDYLLFAISNEDKPLSSVQTMNTVHPRMYKSGNGSEKDHQVLEIRQPAAIGDSENEVMIITAVGVVLGRLIPGATSYRQPGNTEFRRVYIIFAESQVFEGDCGAAVIDASTGCFYGQVVLGVPGTPLAYLVPSSEILQDIENQTGLKASLDMRQLQKGLKNVSRLPGPSMTFDLGDDLEFAVSALVKNKTDDQPRDPLMEGEYQSPFSPTKVRSFEKTSLSRWLNEPPELQAVLMGVIGGTNSSGNNNEATASQGISEDAVVAPETKLP